MNNQEIFFQMRQIKGLYKSVKMIKTRENLVAYLFDEKMTLNKLRNIMFRFHKWDIEIVGTKNKYALLIHI